MKITVLNTGGTFNKRYNPITGQLEVPSDNIALDKIIKSCFNVEFDIKNIVSKDSLDFTQEDRETILENIKNSTSDKIIKIY
jgi:L-asparaginase